MTIETVRDNLKNTIAGKEELLTILTNPRYQDFLNVPEQVARLAVVAFLEVNLGELKAILADVEKCV